MSAFTVQQAQQQLSVLLQQAAQGKPVTITDGTQEFQVVLTAPAEPEDKWAALLLLAIELDIPDLLVDSRLPLEQRHNESLKKLLDRGVLLDDAKYVVSEWERSCGVNLFESVEQPSTSIESDKGLAQIRAMLASAWKVEKPHQRYDALKEHVHDLVIQAGRWQVYTEAGVLYPINQAQKHGRVVAVLDKKHHLMWSYGLDNRLVTWAEAEAWLQRLNQQRWQGFDDWTLPSIQEIATLLIPCPDGHRYVGERVFADTCALVRYIVWSKTQVSEDKQYVYNLSYSHMVFAAKDTRRYVRFVRQWH